MKILKVTGGYPPAEKQGGTAIVGHALSRALSDLGCDIKVLTTNINGNEHLPWANEWREWDGVQAFYAKGSRGLRPHYCPELLKQCSQLLGQVDVVLMASVWTWYGPKVGKMCRKAGVPYIMYAHGCRARDRVKMQGRLKKTFWWHAFDRKLYDNAAAIVAITQEEKDELHAIGVKAPIEVIPNGIEPGLQVANSREHIKKRYGISDESDIVYFLGRIEPIKGVDIAIKALHEVAADHPNAILVVAGPEKDGMQAQMERLAESLGLRDRIIFTGSVKGDDKWAMFQEAVILVLPSVTEVLAMSVLEALDCGVPVVLTQKHAWPQIVEAQAGIITDRNPQAVGDALKTLLADPQLREAMGRKGKELVERAFRWPNIAQRTIDLCQSVIAK